MNKLSRRDFLLFSVSLSLSFPHYGFADTGVVEYSPTDYPNTISVLKQAYLSEIIAYKRYIGYVKQALVEKYPNIAYMFHAFSVSEKVHADNYNRIIHNLGHTSNKVSFPSIIVRDTKANLLNAAEKELEKIEKSYPDFLNKVKSESFEDALINLIYSWKSHQQHEVKLKKIQKYTDYFFGSVAREIEGMTLDIHVCEICGSTIDVIPVAPCNICNKSESFYKKIIRPV